MRLGSLVTQASGAGQICAFDPHTLLVYGLFTWVFVGTATECQFIRIQDGSGSSTEAGAGRAGGGVWLLANFWV